MARFETFAAYFGRLITLEALLWIVFLLLISFLLRKALSPVLRVSTVYYLLISLSFAGVVGLSLRFWDAYGTLSTFWLVAPDLWSAGLKINANLVLNVCLYIPLATLLVLARKRSWKVLLVLGALSFLIETTQQYLRIGAGDPFDLFANIMGTLVGVTIGTILVRLFPTLAAALRQ